MQKDKNWPKVITERPRVGSTRREGSRADRALDRRIRARGGWEDLPTRARMFAAQHRGELKEFSDHLNPLHRWLHAQVGRQWDEVYSEARQMIDNRTTTGQHVFGHLMAWVELNPLVVDGKVGKLGRYTSGWFEIVSRKGDWQFYVLADGVLRLAPNAPRRRYATTGYQRTPPRTDNPVHKAGNREYEKFNGLWFEVWLEPAKEHVRGTFFRDTFVVVRKRQLGWKELRDLGLKND